ncbi:unnamed protein product [Parnassius mnemosyne]|uniref:Reverse transcriptase domain-containing protein n=1 Tax=Parnassius mnemosyne TaxID=213953 RepID=A0AAV1KAV4_9NEOP
MDNVTKNSLSIYYQNVRGLRSKTTVFFRNLCMSTYDIIILTETWLFDGIFDSELFDDRYIVWKRDRDYSLTHQTRGGGVLIAIHKWLACTLQPTYFSTAEDLWVTLTLHNNKPHIKTNLHICVLYLCSQNTGNSFSVQLKNFLTNLERFISTYPDDRFLVAGDFNLSAISWLPNGDHFVPTGNKTFDENLLVDELNLLGLNQYNGVVNAHGKILDLVLSNFTQVVSSCCDPLVPIDLHHGALLIESHLLDFIPLRPAPRNRFLYNKGDYTSINAELLKIDWASEFHPRTVDECVDYFYSTFHILRDKFIPSKTIVKHQYPRWYSLALIKVIKEQYKYHKKFKIYNNRSDYESMKLLRVRAKALECKCYTDYLASVENSITKNPKNFWSFTKSRSNSNVMPSTLFYNHEVVKTGSSICEAFSDYFSSNFLDDTSTQPTCDPAHTDYPPSIADISKIYVSEQTVLNLLLKLDQCKSAGPDHLPAVFLINCARSLVTPVTLLFNKSLAECTVPAIWKSAFITPIHKKGSRDQVNNYRPISKLCILSKVLEKIVHSQLYLAIRQSLHDFQHGFLPGRSTVTNLALLNDFLTDSMDKGHQIDVIYTDYSKAFDRINHSRLLYKLKCVGISGDLLRWFSSYIENRTQAVVVNNYISSWVKIPSGVPQGSLLAPLLFAIFVNDINNCLCNSRLLCFADDMKIFSNISSLKDAEALQNDLRNLLDYCTYNHLDLNPTKCSVVTFSRKPNKLLYDYHIGGQSLSRDDSVRDLGVIHDSKLLFDKHIENIIGRSTRALGFVMRCSKNFKQIKTLKILYCCYVRSILEYASQIWNPQYKTYISRIERIQMKFIKHLCYRVNDHYNSNHYYDKCRKFHLLPLEMRRQIADITFLLKIASSEIDCPDLLEKLNIKIPKNVRRKVPLLLPATKTNYRQNSYMYRASKYFNTVSQLFNLDLFNSSIISARRVLSKPFFNSS